MAWSEYGKWSLSLVRDFLAHLEYLLMVLLTFPRTALEIGCGTGLHSYFISYFGIEVVSVDIDRKVVKMASSISRHYKAKNVAFVVADVRNLPFRRRVFTVCFSQGLLEHFNNQAIRDVILEAKRVAEAILFSVPSINYPTQDFGDERLLTPWQWKALMSEFDAKVKYYRLDLQSIKNSLLSWKIPRPWHILIEIQSRK
jgi:SAM-dependent methyltransferase